MLHRQVIITIRIRRAITAPNSGKQNIKIITDTVQKKCLPLPQWSRGTTKELSLREQNARPDDPMNNTTGPK